MGKSTNGNAVRIYTLNERATKFRNTAACLSWGEKTGSAEKKAYILNLLPAGATDTRSLGKDLTKQQQAELVAANKGQFPNRRRKAKRTLEAQAPMAIPTPGFQPGASSVGGDVAGQSDQLGAEADLSSLQRQNSQSADMNEPRSFNDRRSFGSGSQLGAPHNMIGLQPNVPFPAAGANYIGYHHAPGIPYLSDVLAPSQLTPSQNVLDNGGHLSSINSLGNYSYATNTSGHPTGMNFLSSAQYGAVYRGQSTGEFSLEGAARGYTSLHEQGDSLLDRPLNAPLLNAPPLNAPMQRRKRTRTAPAEDENENHDNRRSKRARTDAPVEAPQETSPEILTGEGESLLRFDENGYVITDNMTGTQAQGEFLCPADFEEFLKDTQHGEEDAEGEDVEETGDAPEAQGSHDTLPGTPAPLPTQGQKRRRSSSPEDVEEGAQGPKAKRPRTEEDVQTPEGSTTNVSEGSEATARPVNVARGQKRGRGSSESRADTDASVETPPAKRQRTTPSSDEAGTSPGADSTTTDDEPTKTDEASESSSEQSSDDSDGSEYTPSPYTQTSLKTIARPTTGGKGPYGADGRPVTGGKGKGKGKGPLKSSRRANMARKAPAKQQ